MMNNPTILIVDDEKNTRDGLSRALKQNYTVLVAEQGTHALEILGEHHVDLVLTDLRMPGLDGMALLQQILARTPRPICILLTAYGSIETAVEAMKAGAFDFLTKPVNLDHLDLVLSRALRSRDMERENRHLQKQLNDRYGLENIVGQSETMKEVFDTIRQVGPSRATVLIEGESGTGKELAAHAIHRLSLRAGGPFVAVHCAALQETLLESELFGHEKGAFTGASERRKGRFELADGGTLFLDEIAEINPSTQVKILRALEERKFERVGGQETIEVDVRILAATSRDLKQMVKEGTMREDLFYRLYVVVLQLPPLRNRPGDIPLLVHSFIEEFSQENEKTIQGITSDALGTLTGYSWPGNVRELRNTIERMVVLTRGDKLTLRDVPPHLKEEKADLSRTRLDRNASLEEVEKQVISDALKTHDGNRTKTAAQLGISRRTLHRKLNEYGLRDHENGGR